MWMIRGPRSDHNTQRARPFERDNRKDQEMMAVLAFASSPCAQVVSLSIDIRSLEQARAPGIVLDAPWTSLACQLHGFGTF